MKASGGLGEDLFLGTTQHHISPIVGLSLILQQF
jgi:hypothetical protein